MTFHHPFHRSAETWNTQTRANAHEWMSTSAMRCGVSRRSTRTMRATPLRTEYPERGGMPTGKGYAPPPTTTIPSTSLIEKGGTGGTGGTSALSIAPTGFRAVLPGGTAVERKGLASGLLGRSSPRAAFVAPDNPRAGESTSGKSVGLTPVGRCILPLRVGAAFPASPGPIFPDLSSHASSHAPGPLCSVLITKRRSGAITPTCQSVRSGGVVGDRGVGKKVGDIRSDHPLHLHCGHRFASPIC